MIRHGVLLSLASLAPLASQARLGEVRSLDDVFLQSNEVVQAFVVGSGIGACGGLDGNNAIYTLRVTVNYKGDIAGGDVKACGSAPLLLGNKYLIAGNKHADGDFVFASDAVLLVFPNDTYYRLISNDSPVVASDRGEAYAVGLLAPYFTERYRKLLKLEPE